MTTHALIIGQAPNDPAHPEIPDWEYDVREAARLFAEADVTPTVIAINGAGMHYLNHIDYWVSLHGEHLLEWIPRRLAEGGNGDVSVHGSFGVGNGYENPWESNGITLVREQRPNPGGGSAHAAVDIAREKWGIDRFTLAGCPLTGLLRVPYGGIGDTNSSGVTCPTVNGFSKPNQEAGFPAYRRGWINQYKQLKDIVRSLSGWTREKYGPPTIEWMQE